MWRVCFCVSSSGLHGDTLPLHALPRLWDYVSCVHYAALHGQQHTTGKINPWDMTYDFLFLPFVLQKHFFIWLSSQSDNVSPLFLKKLHQSRYNLHYPSLFRLSCFGKCLRKSLCAPQQAWHKNPAPQCSLPPWRYSLSPLRQPSCAADCQLFMFSLCFKPVRCHSQRNWTWRTNVD